MVQRQRKLNIQVYAPTSDCSEQESIDLYDQMEEQIRDLGGRSDCVVIVMGDRNSTVGEQQEPNITGSFSLGTRYHKGQLLIDYCREKKNFRSTYGTQVLKRRHTWNRADGTMKR